MTLWKCSLGLSNGLNARGRGGGRSSLVTGFAVSHKEDEKGDGDESMEASETSELPGVVVLLSLQLFETSGDGCRTIRVLSRSARGFPVAFLVRL